MRDGTILAEIRALRADWLLIKEAITLLEKKFVSAGSFTLKAGFELAEQLGRGKALLVGEGNLSSTLSLLRLRRFMPGGLTATTYESEAAVILPVQENARMLRSRGVDVLHGVDATDLAPTFGIRRFDNIVFQFPHAGSRDAVEGRNPNFILVRDFLESAERQLAVGGRVFITSVDNVHYRGAFQFDEAAEEAGFEPPEVYPFDPEAFPGYEHTMTHQSVSALEDHDTFSTWVFRR